MIKEVPTVVKKRQKHWKSKDSLNSTFHFVLGGACAGLAAFMSVVDLDISQSKFISGIVAACAALLTFWQPGARAKSFRTARDLLRIARTKYEELPNYTEEELIDAMEKAQNTIRGE